MPTSTMEFNETVDDGPATRNDIVNDADVLNKPIRSQDFN